MFLFDANIFLELLLDQEKSKQARKALEWVSDRKLGWVTSFSIHAIEAIAGSRKRFDVIAQFLEFLSVHPYFYRYSTTTDEEQEISVLASQMNLDFDDALQVYVAKKVGLELVTFDKDFSKIDGLVTIVPT